jgi:F-type H+-transporting ATPase subunit b
MEFDWTTVILEMLNFLVLIWLLKRFFYRPVLAVIEKRRAAGEKFLTDADARHREADALKGDYEQRLAQFGKERELAMARLDEEIAAERERRLAAVELEATADRQRRRMLEARETGEREAAMEREAVAIAGRFASRFLDRLAGPELETKLVDLALAELQTVSPEKLAELRTALRDPATSIKVVTVYPLDATRRASFAAMLGSLVGRELTPQFQEDATLKSGLCLMAGAWVLMANLRDELNFFTSAVEHG